MPETSKHDQWGYPDHTALQAATAGLVSQLRGLKSHLSSREWRALVGTLQAFFVRELDDEGPATSWASVMIEGAVDRFCGRPRERTPYAPECVEARSAWDRGWTEAGDYLEARAQEEARRWLEAA